MKKTLLSIIVLTIFYFSSINAQIDQGTWLVGTSSSISLVSSSQEFMKLGFTSQKSKSDDYTSDPTKQINFNLQPKVGYLVINNLAVGLDIQWIYSRQKEEEYDYKYSQNIIAAGPFIRYYIPAGKVIPFAEVGGTFGGFISKDDYNGDEDTDKSRLLTFTGKAGAAIPLGEVVHFEMALLYNYMSIKDKEDNDNNTRYIIGTFGLNLGFIVLL